MSDESTEDIDKPIYGSAINQIGVEYEPIITEVLECTSAECNIDFNIREKLRKVLESKASVICRNKNDLGFCSTVKHDIVTRPVAPINMTARRVPLALEKKWMKQ